MITGLFIRLTRSVVDSFKNAFQLFADVWSPIAEAFINLGCSILFGYLWGLNGIIMGSNLSLIIIVLIWKPYYTFRNGLKSPASTYYLQYVLHLCVLLGCFWFIRSGLSLWGDLNMEDFWFQILWLTGAFAAYIVSTYLLLFVFTDGMRRFTFRITNIITQKI